MISHLKCHSNQLGEEKIEEISTQIRDYLKYGIFDAVKCVFCDLSGYDKGTNYM